MTTTAAPRRPGGLIDRRLAARVAATRRYVAMAVAVGLVATASVVAQAVLLATVVERSVLHHVSVGTLIPELVGLAVAFLVRAACGWLGEAAAQRTSATVTSVLRRQMLRHALDLGPGWLAGERAGELSLAATRGTAALDTYFGRYLPQAILAALAPAGLLVWVAWEDWVSALILIGLVGLVPVAMVFFGRESARRTREQWRRLSSLSARFLDLVRGLPTLRAFGRESHGRRQVAEATEGLRQTTMGTLRVAFLSALALEFLAGIGTGLVAMVLGLRLLGGSVSLFTALAVLLVSPEVFLPLRRAGSEFHASAEGQAAAERILGMLDEPVPFSGGGPAAGAPAAGAPAATWTEPAAGPVVFDGVSVQYPGRAMPALDRFHLTLEPGEHVALVGPSGAGKSTALGLLLRFVVPSAGRLTVAGSELLAVDPAAWRRRLTWVPQRPHLLTGTVADNLRLGNPSATDAQLLEVLEAVGLGSVIGALPRGLATPLGERGLTFSAGERQRLAIARAVLRDAPIVLLDEPVSHLDRTTEAALREALAPWLESRTVLVAAHRPELVGRIDRIVELPVAGGNGSTSTGTVGLRSPAASVAVAGDAAGDAGGDPGTEPSLGAVRSVS